MALLEWWKLDWISIEDINSPGAQLAIRELKIALDEDPNNQRALDLLDQMREIVGYFELPDEVPLVKPTLPTLTPFPTVTMEPSLTPRPTRTTRPTSPPTTYTPTQMEPVPSITSQPISKSDVEEPSDSDSGMIPTIALSSFFLVVGLGMGFWFGKR